jgi:predicted dehydrogenase
MALNLEQAKKMLQACKENNVILMIGHQSRYAPINARFKEMIDEGMLGKMFLVRVMQGFYPGLRDFHYQKDKIGGGVLISTGIHVIDLTRWFAGDVKRVAYAGNSLIRGMEGEDTAVMTLEFENGAVGTLISSWAVRPGATHFWIHGEKGSLTTEGGLLFIDNEGKILQEEVETVDAIHKELEHYVDCIISGKQPLTSGEEGYKALEVAVAAYRSEAESRIIDIATLK